jgi:hypothetical protein
MNVQHKYTVIQQQEDIFNDGTGIDYDNWSSKTTEPATLLLSDVNFQDNWEDKGSYFEREGTTTKEVAITYNKKLYVQPVGAKIILRQWKNIGSGGKYTATFIDSPHKQHGGKRRSIKNRRRRSRSTRRNKRR